MPPHLKEVDKSLFENLCAIQCTEMEMCEVLHIDDKTLNKWCKRTYGAGFSETYEKKRGTGKISLRRLQYQSAQAGNVTMQIWLGKQWLGQSDKQEVLSNATVVNRSQERIKSLAELINNPLPNRTFESVEAAANESEEQVIDSAEN